MTITVLDSILYRRKLHIAAILAAIIHFFAGLYMLLILQKGLDTAEFGQRLSFITNNELLWTIGWLLWTAADFSILYFYFCFMNAHKKDTNSLAYLLHYALFIAIVGFAFDLIAEIIEMSVLPELAHKILTSQINISAIDTELFTTVNRIAVLITGFLANGAYSISGALMILITRKQYGLLVKSAGCIMVLAGLYLSWACYANIISAMVISNAILLPALLFWLLGVAYDSKVKNQT